MTGCIFCRIAAGEAPAQVEFADDRLVVFRDLAPRAPVHLLVIPRQHVASLAAARREDAGLLGDLLLAAAAAAARAGVADGFRVVTNTGPGAGQSVHHLHLHVLGGRLLSWPPG
ncbi:MAG TPA: HIT domain-containing protein [Thermoanaerobaculaceae bacterium]|nr:HIT domain-containing protein [Thermoanaerobaculaceae bacterium]